MCAGSFTFFGCLDVYKIKSEVFNILYKNRLIQRIISATPLRELVAAYLKSQASKIYVFTFSSQKRQHEN
jgi:hypothetical protein